MMQSDENNLWILELLDYCSQDIWDFIKTARIFEKKQKFLKIDLSYFNKVGDMSDLDFEDEISFPSDDILDRALDPFEVFFDWYKQAEIKDNLANAAVLSTVRADQKPSSRYVLIKDVSRDKGFVFYTNLNSNKSKEIFVNPYVSICFFWLFSGRQVRVIGRANLLSDSEADEYFRTRPRLSQISAWASDQSSPVESYEVLKKRFYEFSEKFKGQEVPRPPWWKGFYVIPEEFDFLIYTLFRLHKRVQFVMKNGIWLKTYLCP